MIWIPFAGAISEAVTVILEKKMLRKRKINYKHFAVFAFFFAVIVMLPLLYFFWKFDFQALELKNLFVLFFIVACAIAANLLTFYSLKREKISELEPIRLFQPLFVILLAFLLYSGERKLSILIVSLIASLALVFSHIKKHHFKFNKYLIAALLGCLFYALELSFSKLILPYYSSFSFYFIRSVFVLAVIAVIFRPKFSEIDKNSKLIIFIIGILWVVLRVILYYGYMVYGVIFTTLLFILAPVFIYAFAKIFLKEKITWRNIVATVIIISCIAYAILIQAGIV